MNKSLILLCLISINAYSFQWGDYTSQIELAREIQNSKMMRKEKSLEDAAEQLNNLINGLNNDSISMKSNSEKLFLVGISYNGLLKANRHSIWKTIPRGQKWFESAEFKGLMLKIEESYVKGLDAARNEGGIDPEWLYIITQSTILPTKVREEITRYEMHVNQKNPPTETYFWDSYSSIYEAYLNKKDYVNAQRILDEMALEFPALLDKVEKATLGIRQYVEARELSTPVVKDANKTSEEQRTLPPVAASKSIDVEPTGNSIQVNDSEFRWGSKEYLLLIIVFSLSVLLFLYRRRRH